MILGQTLPYLRRREFFTSAEQWGASVASHEFVRAVLRTDAVDGIHFFLSPSTMLRGQTVDSLAELRDDFAGYPLELKDQSDLMAAVREHTYVFAETAVILPGLAYARQALPEPQFPITGITHAIPRLVDTMTFFGIFMFGEPFDAIVTTSEAGKKAIESILAETGRFLIAKLGSQNLSFPRVVKIPLGVDEQFLSPCDPAVARLALGLPLNETIILYLGRLTERFKADLEPLLVAFGRISRHRPNLRLLLAGNDSQDGYGQALGLMASQMGIAECVTIIKDFPYAQKPLMYSSSDIFVSPVDNIQETFGLSVLEAMASGLPVVASDWSGYRDLIEHEVSGFLVATIWNSAAGDCASHLGPLWGDSIRTGHFLAQNTVVDLSELCGYLKLLCENRELRKSMGSRARERVLKEFCWPVVVSKYKALWEEQLTHLQDFKRKRNTSARFLANYDEVYGHFATRSLQDVLDIVVLHAHENRELNVQVSEARPPFNVSLREAQRILGQCEREPQSIGDLLAGGYDKTARTLMWLWKKGYLEGQRT
jgi:glycosyltransferase involved in cell wall biosynthesis